MKNSNNNWQQYVLSTNRHWVLVVRSERIPKLYIYPQWWRSDFCIVVNLIEQLNSVSSGEELVCTHKTFYGGDQSPTTERQGNHKLPFVIFNFGPHGIPLKSNHKLSIASVSKIYTVEGYHLLSVSETAARDALSKPVGLSGLGEISISLDLLTLMFEAIIGPL